MSILFKDSATGGMFDAGYFRIGFVTLSIPPQNIATSRVVNNEKIATLRGMNEMFQKTGQSRWDVTVSWTVLQNELAGSDTARYRQWDDLCNLVAIFKAAPFVEVESPHLRHLLVGGDPETATKRMAFGLRQLRIDTHPDIVDGLTVSLTMTYFNYLPFSLDFGYQGDSGQAVNADQSAKFSNYIKEWRRANMDTRPNISADDPACPAWQAQAPGEMAIRYRQYTAFPTGEMPNFAGPPVAGTAPATSSTAKPSAAKPFATPQTPKGYITNGKPLGAMLSANFSQQQLRVVGASAQIIQNAAYLCNSLLEPIFAQFGTVNLTNGYRDPGHNARVGGKPNSYHLYNGTTAAADIVCPGASLQQVFDWISLKSGLPFDEVILETSPRTGKLACVHLQINSAVAGRHAAYTGLTGNATSYKPQTTDRKVVAQKQAIPSPLPAAASAASASSRPVTYTDSKTVAAYSAEVAAALEDKWNFDHTADPGGVGMAFMYKEHELRLFGGDSRAIGQPGLWPGQMTILFVNNLVQIPLAGYQYPTYQHLGPSSSMVQVSFVSKGDSSNQGDVDTTEPIHSELAALTSMAHNLEQQYHKLRTMFRTVKSVHRMQAVFVENQVLNMLGIWGLMVDQVATSTMTDAADMVTAQLTACQYENVFEELTTFKVNAVDAAYMSALQTVVLGDMTSPMNNVPMEERTALNAAFSYRTEAAMPDENALNARLLKAAQQDGTSNPFSFMKGAGSFYVSEADSASLTSAMLSKASSYPVAVARLAQLKQAGTATQWTVADYLMFKECFYDANHNAEQGAGGILTAPVKSVVSTIDASLAATAKSGTTGTNRQEMVKDAYTRLFPYFAENDLALRNALNQIMQSPTMGAAIKAAVSPNDPSYTNPGHGAYRDMGLNTQNFNGEDFNPGMYFVEAKLDYAEKVQKALEGMTAGAAAMTVDSNGNKTETQVEIPLGSVVRAAVATAGIPGISNLVPFLVPVGNGPPVTVSLPMGSVPFNATTSLTGDVESIKKMIHIPGYSMREAFPTFKLFFMEDASSGIYYAFDNFYSYASVLDIEVQRPTGRPATMRLKLSNLTHLLSHKLYDGSLVGNYELSKDRGGLHVDGNNGAVAGPEGAQLIGTAVKGLLGGPAWGYDNREGYKNGIDGPGRRIPLQYFPLQTGSKVQLRMGFSNNPDKLTPVFCGQVTEIEGNEILTVTAQSYLTELMTVSADGLPSNGSWLTAGKPALGGLTMFGDLGDARTVIWKMLKVAGAKHFGRWQINAPTTTLLSGFSWKEIGAQDAGSIAASLGADNIATALQNTHDRSADNLMVNVVVQSSGNAFDVTAARAGGDEHPFGVLPAKYFIDNALPYTPWDVIQDVARRYPEYLLLEKWYGFPYSCDSTLVFGHPFGWYRARPSMLGDQERMRALDQNGDAYRKWWASGGAGTFEGVMNQITRSNDTGLLTTFFSNERERLRILAGTGPDGLKAASEGLRQIALHGFGDDPWTNALFSRIAGASNMVFKSGGEAFARKEALIASILVNFQSTLLGADQQSTDLLKPIRRYHFIDHQSIVHNGMTRNDKIYNATQMRSGTKAYVLPANPNIVNNHLRVLDVTDRMVCPEDNVISPSFGSQSGYMQAYSQSFLKTEVGKMYKGEIVLRGIPEIEPQDVLLILDPSTGIVGPVIVDTVTHIMNLEEGFITVVKPLAVVIVNEAASAGFIRLLLMTMGTVIPDVLRLKAMSAASLTGAGATAVGVGAAATAGWAGLSWFAAAAPTAAANLAFAIGGGATTSMATGAAAISVAEGVALACSPPGWAIAVLCVVAGATFMLTKTAMNEVASLFPLAISPCTQFGRPWVAGVDGWSMEDLIGVINNKTEQFMAEEVYPLLDAWKGLHGYPPPVPPTALSSMPLAPPAQP